MKLWKNSPPRRLMLALAGALLASSTLALTAAAGAGAGATTATPTAGPIALLATIGSGPSGKIVVAGAIGDWGTTLTITKDGKPDQHGNYVKVTLKKGSFEIDSTALNRKTTNPHCLGVRVLGAVRCAREAAGRGGMTQTPTGVMPWAGICLPPRSVCRRSDLIEACCFWPEAVLSAGGVSRSEEATR